MHAVARLRPAFLSVLVSAGLLGAVTPVAAQFTDVALDTQLDSADALTDWRSNATLSRDTQIKKRGDASLKSVGNQTDRFKKTFSSPLNVSNHRFLTFWYYIDEPSKITGGQVEITSAGTHDQQEFNWKVPDLHLQRGWNYVVLDLPGKPAGDMPIDLTRINYFRLYHQLSGSVTTRIDQIVFTNRQPASLPLADFFDDKRLATGPDAVERYDTWLDFVEATPSGTGARRRACRRERLLQFHREVSSLTLQGMGVNGNLLRDAMRARRQLMEYLCDERALTRTALLTKLEERAQTQVAVVRDLATAFGLTAEAASETFARTLQLDLERISATCGTQRDEVERYVANGTVPAGMRGVNVLVRNCQTDATDPIGQIATAIGALGAQVPDRKTAFSQCMAKFGSQGAECDNPYAMPPDEAHRKHINEIKEYSEQQKNAAITRMQDLMRFLDAITPETAREDFGFESHPRPGSPNPEYLESLHRDYDALQLKRALIEWERKNYDYNRPFPGDPDYVEGSHQQAQADKTRLWQKMDEIQSELEDRGAEICYEDPRDPICAERKFDGKEPEKNKPAKQPENSRCAAYTFKDGSRGWFDRSPGSSGQGSQINETDRLDHCLCELFDRGYVDSLPGNEFSTQLGGCPTPEENLAQKCLDDPREDDGRMKGACLFIMKPASLDRDSLGGQMCEKVLPDCDKDLLYKNTDGSCGCGTRAPSGSVQLPGCTSLPNCTPDQIPTRDGCGCEPLDSGGNACTPGGKDFYLTNSLSDLKVRAFPSRPNFADANLLAVKTGKTRFVTAAFKRRQLYNDTTLVLRPVLTGTTYDGTGSIKLSCTNMSPGGVKNLLFETIPMSTLHAGIPTAVFITLSNTEKAQCFGNDPESNVHFEVFVDGKLGQPVAFYDILEDLGHIKPPCTEFPPRPTPGPRPLSTWPQLWTFSDGTVVEPFYKLNGLGAPQPGANPGIPTIPNPPVCIVEGVVVPCPN